MPATVTPVSGSLGNKETATLTAYTVTPEAGSTVTSIVEKVNGVTVNTFNNPASLSRTLTVPQATWDTLAYFATHTASVTVTDSNGATTATTYSFDKRLATGASLLEATKANTDAKNRIAQKRDALAAQVGLSAGATFDAISAQLASNAFKKSMTGTMNLTPTTITISGLAFKPEVVYYSRKDSQSPAIFGSVFKSPSFGTGIHMMHSTSGSTQVSTTGVVFGDTSVSFPNSLGSTSIVDYVVMGK